MNSPIPHHVQQFGTRHRVGRQRMGAAIRSNRFTFGVAMILAIIIPELFHPAVNQHYEWVNPLIQIEPSLMFATLALLGAHVVLRRVGILPLVDDKLLILPVFLTSYSLTYAALKGARLAWHAYRHPALRPMRDLDILVSPERMRETWNRLVDHGFSAGPGYALPPDGGLAVHKHLPALRDPASEVHVEVHSRLFEHLDAAHSGAAMNNADGLLADRVWLALGLTKIAYLPATEALLHLIVHSAYEHHFENGPQVLHDLAAQMECEVIDWPRFWRLAREGGWERGCHLLLQLTEEFLGEQPIDWGPDSRAAIPRQVLDKSALLMLQDPDLRQDLSVQVQLAAQAGSAWAKAWRLLARLFVRSEVVAAYAGLAPDHPRIWLHYPRWLVSRLARTLAGKLNRHQQAEVSRASAVEAWLGGN